MKTPECVCCLITNLTGWTTLQALTATNYLNEFVDGQAVRCPYRSIESCRRNKTIPVHTPLSSYNGGMRIASGHNEKNFYNELNKVAEGRLYDQIKVVAAEPIPRNYAMFKQPQRQRLGQAWVADQFHWSIAEDDRAAKEGSALGASIIRYLESVEPVSTPEQTLHLAEVISLRLGEIAAKIMEGVAQRAPAQAAPSTGPVMSIS